MVIKDEKYSAFINIIGICGVVFLIISSINSAVSSCLSMLKTCNGFMISFAPANDPQIAVVIAIENVTSGGLGNYVAEVYEAYFNRDSEISSSQQNGIILN
jgi:hypothetical protein